MRPRNVARLAHLELHTGDGNRAGAFLSHVAGWQPQSGGANDDGCTVLALSDYIGGSIVECGSPVPQWVPYAVVDGLDAALERADRLGATVLCEPREGPAGWRTVITSPAGGPLALWQLRPEWQPRRRLR